MPLLLAFLIALQPGEPPKSLSQEAMSGVDMPREAVVRTADEWERLWRAHAGGAPRPEVDFSTTMVAAVFLGTRMSAGYAVEITGTRREGEALVVEWVERRPPPGAVTAQVITTPAHLVALPRFDGEVRFEQVRR